MKSTMSTGCPKIKLDRILSSSQGPKDQDNSNSNSNTSLTLKKVHLVWQLWSLLTCGNTWGVLIGSKLMVCIQEWPSKGFEGLGPNLFLSTCKIHFLMPWITISQSFPKADFIFGHTVYFEQFPQKSNNLFTPNFGAPNCLHWKQAVKCELEWNNIPNSTANIKYSEYTLSMEPTHTPASLQDARGCLMIPDWQNL